MRVFRWPKIVFLLCLGMLFLSLPACIQSSGDETATTTTATKAATIVISETALQSDIRSSISSNAEGEYLFSKQNIDTSTNVTLTLYNSGDVAADKIKAYSLSSPLAYAGGSYPGNGGTCTKTIAAQATCTIVVSFSPTKMGENSSTLKLGYYNGKTTRTFEQVFKGTGVSNPTITNVSPSAGPVEGGNTLTLSGTQLFNGALVTVGGNSCSITSYYEPTTIMCTLPAHAPASTDIVLTNVDRKSTTLTNAYTYQVAPTVLSVNPPYGSIGGDTTITITGTGFLTGATVLIGGQTCAVANVVSSTQITCVTPTHALGSVDVRVINSDSQSGTLTNGFSYSPPTITSLSSSVGSTSGFATVQVNGTGFLDGASVTFGGLAANVTAITLTQITVITPSHPSGTVDVVVTNSFDGQSGTASNAYTYSTTANENWVRMTTLGAPTPRGSPRVFWTGSQLISIAGYDFSTIVNTGGIYDPLTDSWFTTSTTGAPSRRYGHVGAWTGTKIVIWGGQQTDSLNTGGVYDPLLNTWTTMSTTGAPPPASQGSAVWTGSKVLIWGGVKRIGGVDTSINNGALYDPLSNSWTSMPTTGAPTERYWFGYTFTGKEFLVSGGQNTVFLNDGAKYDLEQNSWSAITTTNAPAIGPKSNCHWTGSKMLVWGNDIANVNTGALYDPASNTWTRMSTTGAPPEIYLSTSVWTGSNLLVWGGSDTGGQYPNTGAIYNPESNQWQIMTSNNSPTGKITSSVWTGSKLIVWAGSEYAGVSPTNAGGIYTPPSSANANTWTTITTTGAPSRRAEHPIVWTGSKMIVWGGAGGSPYFTNSGGSYDPVTNSWTTLATVALTGRFRSSGIWTGSKMIIWGGYDGVSYDNDGATYDPNLNNWTMISTTGAPSPRMVYHSGIWTGSRMILWGEIVNDGGIYDPGTDTWTSVSTTNSPSGLSGLQQVWTGSHLIVLTGAQLGKYNPVTDLWSYGSSTNTAVSSSNGAVAWTGSKILYWGGCGYGFGGVVSCPTNVGAIYDVSADSWTKMTTVNAPSPRFRIGGSWTGKNFFVFGGATDSGPVTFTNSGGLYDPVLNQWTVTTTSGALGPRQLINYMIWTGKNILIWGGEYGGAHNTGGIYTPP